MHLRKYDLTSLLPGCLDWLRKHRVPVSHFGLRLRVDHAAFFGRSCPDLPSDMDPPGPGAGTESAAAAPQASTPSPQARHPASADPPCARATSRIGDQKNITSGGAAKRPATRQTRRRERSWCDVGRVDLGSPLLGHKQLLAHLRQRSEWSDCRVAVRTVWQNKERIQSEIRCVESKTCQCMWRTHYILAKTIYSPGTLVIQRAGDHSGHGVSRSASGKFSTSNRSTQQQLSSRRAVGLSKASALHFWRPVLQKHLCLPTSSSVIGFGEKKSNRNKH